jgi:hypothetical protein
MFEVGFKATPYIDPIGRTEDLCSMNYSKAVAAIIPNLPKPGLRYKYQPVFTSLKYLPIKGLTHHQDCYANGKAVEERFIDELGNVHADKVVW